MNPSPPITILGAGGIGCAIGHGLSDGGLEVTFVDTDEAKIQAGQRQGVTIEGQGSRPASFERFEDWTPTGDELILLCIKCYDNQLALKKIPLESTIIPVQNGFDPTLQERCTFEGIASFVSECGPGDPSTRLTRDGDLHLGPSGNQSNLSESLKLLAEVLTRHASFTVKVVDDVLPFKNTKLMYNAAISPLAAVTGMDNGALLTNARARKLFFAFLRENYAILKRAGVPLGTVGPFHPDTVNRILRAPLLGTIMSGPFSRSLKGTYCSMSGDIETGRTEVENFNGHLVRLAAGRDCPLNQAACDLVNQMASEKATPSMPYLDQLT